MSVTLTRSLFPLEMRTWIAVLGIGVGFGTVVEASLLLEGLFLKALLVLPIPVVFGYTAATLHRATPVYRPRVATLANVALMVTSATAMAIDAAPVARAGLDDTHPVVTVITLMSILLHTAVVVVAYESLHRLPLRGEGS